MGVSLRSLLRAGRPFADAVSLRSRLRKHDLFMELVCPEPHETIVDVGVAGFGWANENILEVLYPHKERITAVGISEQALSEMNRRYPEINCVHADGRSLPFPDGHFDIGYSNAVVEHVGPLHEQRKFISELARVSRRFFVTTPNLWFPIEVHTLLPFVHWLPYEMRNALFRASGYGTWTESLWLLSKRRFISLFPPSVQVSVYGVGGPVPVSLIAVGRRRDRLSEC